MENSIDIYAPVVIPTLCRYKHLKNCITSLASCEHAAETILFVALDYPAFDKHRDGYERIREYLPTVSGFKDVVIIEREHNLGAVENMRNLIDVVFSKYDKLIFSEDDNVFAPGFLDFVNKALVKFSDNRNVVSVSGYCYPIELSQYRYNVFFTPNFSAWGAGYWKEKYYDNLDKYVNKDYAKAILSSIKKSKQIYRNNPRVLARLVAMSWHNKLHTDTMIVASEIINGKYSLYPQVSFVQNHGFDGSGENCWHKELEDVFSNQPVSNVVDIILDDIQVAESPVVKKSLYNYFNPSIIRSFITVLAYLFLRMMMLFRIK